MSTSRPSSTGSTRVGVKQVSSIHEHTNIKMTRRDASRSPSRKTFSPVVRDRSDSESSEHKDSSAQDSEDQRKPLRHLALLAIALVFGAILGAVSTTTTPSTTIVAPPHSRLRFVEPKTTEEQPARPKARRPSTRRLRFTKI